MPTLRRGWTSEPVQPIELPAGPFTLTRQFTLSLAVAAVAACAACGADGHLHADSRQAADVAPAGRIARRDGPGVARRHARLAAPRPRRPGRRRERRREPRAGGVRSAARCGWTSRTGSAGERRRTGALRVPDRRRPPPARPPVRHRNDPFVAEVVAIEKTRVGGGRARHDRPAEPVALRRDGRRGRRHRPLARPRRRLRRRHRLQHRAAAGRPLRAARREAVPPVRRDDDAVRRDQSVRARVRRLRGDPRGRIRQRRPAPPRRALHAEGRRGRLLRRPRRVDAPLLPALAAEVPARRHLRVLARAHAPDPQDRARASRRRLPRAVRRAGHRRRQRDRGLRRG